MRQRVLILAGTSEATELAAELTAAGIEVTSSFAGVTSRRRERPGHVRVGGFGGPGGLADHLEQEAYDAVVDATHPFAAVMPHNAAEACGRTGVPLLRLLRPGWEAVEGDRWVEVDDLDAAADAVAASGVARVFLSTGRQRLDAFARLDAWCLVRSIDPPDRLPDGWVWVGARGPFTVDGEVDLLTGWSIGAVVAKNAGGDATGAKLAAARRLGLPVVLVRRPPQPPGSVTVTGVGDAVAWVTTRRAGRPGGGCRPDPPDGGARPGWPTSPR